MNGSVPTAAAERAARRRARAPAAASGVWLLLAAAAVLAGRLEAAPQSPADAPPVASAADTASRAERDSSVAPPSLVVSGQGVEGRPIGSIRVIPRNIFEPLPPGRLRAFYRIANRLHIRTRDRTVKEQLLFEAGQTWEEWRARETERNLRQLNFLNPHRIEAVRARDSVHVTVVTRDIWSTSVEFNLESIGGKQYGSMSLNERNLFGLGKSLKVSYNEDPTGITRSLSVDDPNLFGTRARLHYAADKGSSGANDEIRAGVPFYAQETPLMYVVRGQRIRSTSRLYENDDEIATIAVQNREAELQFGLGERRDAVVRRWVASFLSRDRDLGPTQVHMPTPPAFLGGPQQLRTRRLAIEHSIWWPRYLERINIDRISSTEDFDVGHLLALQIGWSPEALGGSVGEGYVRIKAQAGSDSRIGFGWVRASVSSRTRNEPRDILSEADARWIIQPHRRLAFVTAARGVAGDRNERDFQVRVGGLSGLRAYGVDALAGRRLLRLNAEQRWLFGEDLFGMMAAGVVAFTDAARAWGPGSGGKSWLAGVGTGLRLALPTISPDHVLRVDVAWPLSDVDGERRPIVSFGSSQAF